MRYFLTDNIIILVFAIIGQALLSKAKVKKLILIAIILLAALLRFYKLDSVPPSLYWDEASLGYNAYSILKTAKDEHGKFLPTTNFAAFGDYKPPLYIYATVPSIALFGLNEFAIRFPSAFFGTLTVLLAYFIAKKLFDDQNIALTASLFLATSPWHIQLSRGAFEGNLALFLSSLGILTFFKFAKDKPFYILISALSFLAAMYTFTGQRLFVPFILIVLSIQFKDAVKKNIKYVAAAAIICAILFFPLFKFTTDTIEGKLRFNEVTIFKNLEPIDRSTRYRQRDGYSTLSDIVHNRRFLYAREYLIHYFDAFNPTFLFTKGDGNPRFSVQEVGQLYLIDLFLVLAGTYYLFANKQKYRFFILAWLLVSPLGPATARETPHALRMIHILPTFQLIAAYGLISFYRYFRYKKILLSAVALAIVINLLFYLHIYYSHWAKNYSGEWQYGYKQTVEAIRPYYDNADYIIVTKNLGRPYIYFLLYLKFDPEKYRQTADIRRDNFYFIDVKGFDKFRFVDNPDEVEFTDDSIFVLSPGSAGANMRVLDTISTLDGKPILEVSQKIKIIDEEL